MAKKEQNQRKCSSEFKTSVIMDMHEHKLGYKETARKYELANNSYDGALQTLQRWERIYLEEGAAGTLKELLKLSGIARSTYCFYFQIQ